MSNGLKIGKKGVNPTMPLCYFCAEPKGEIILTGLAGEKWAKKNGHADGEMPQTIWIEGDFEPCEECKKKGIGVVEVVSDDDRTPTFRRWIVTEEGVKHVLGQNHKQLETILKQRVFIVPAEVAKRIFPQG